MRLSPHPAQARPAGSDKRRPYDPLDRGRVVRRSTHHDRWSRRLVCPLVLGSFAFFWWAHLTTSAPFRAPGTRPGIRPVIHDGQLEGLVLLSWFPAAFPAAGIASWSSCSRRGIGLSSRSAYPPTLAGTLTGFPCFARTSCDRGGCPLYSGDDGAHPDRGRSTASVGRISATCPSTPLQRLIYAGLRMTKHQPRVQAISPVRSSPRLWPPDEAGALELEPRASHLGRCRRRTSRWGQVIEHGPGPTLYVIDLASIPALFSQCVRPRVARDDAALWPSKNSPATERPEMPRQLIGSDHLTRAVPYH